MSGHGRGYFVLANHSGDALKARLTTTLPVHELRRLDDGGQPAQLPGDAGRLERRTAALRWRDARMAATLAMAAQHPVVGAVDIGGTKIAVGAIDASGKCWPRE